MTTRILLPLRSNAAWFSSADTRVELERRMKRYALLYDQVVLQNGRYNLTALETGFFDRYIAPSSLDQDREKISYFVEGRQFSLRVGAEESGNFHPVLGGEALASYEVDFYPILHDADLLQVDYFAWLNGDVDSSTRGKTKQEAASDRRDPELLALLPNIPFLQSSIINSLYIDAAMARSLQLPFGVDSHTNRVVDWKRQRVQKNFPGDLPDAFFKLWISVGFPDYGNEPWEHVHEVRESGAGKDFRRVIKRIADTVREALPDLDDERAVAEIINREFYQELVRELFSRRASLGKATWNVAANLLPYGSLVSSINDLREALKEENSWICLLGHEETTDAQ